MEAPINEMFFVVSLSLGFMMLSESVLMKNKDPSNKWRYVVYVASAALFVIAGLFLVESGFYLDSVSK